MTQGVICCAVGDEQYAFRASDVRQIARAEQVRGESRPDGSIGRLTVQGRDVPVFALAAALGRDTSASAIARGRHVAVTGDGNETAGWLVDRIARAPMPGNERTLALPPVVGGDATTWFEGLLPLEDRSILLLSPAGLHKKERRCPSAPAARDTSAISPAATTVDDMVVLFSTPALPPCDVARFALAARRLAAVVPSLTLIAVPGSAAFVAGVTRWREAIVTAIDCRRGAGPGGRDDVDDGRRWMLVHSTRALGSGLIALRVEPAIALHHATRENRQLSDRSKSPFLAGVFEIDREPVGFLQLGFFASAISADRSPNASVVR